jgi:hypothetical protein
MYQRRSYQCRGRFQAHRIRRTEITSSSSGEGYLAEPGDWVVERDGHRFAVSDASFRAMFEPIAGEQPDGWEN